MTEESLFAAALERPAGAERIAFLAAACAGDTALRERVERLLAADQRSSGILDRGPDPADLLAACEQDTAVANGPPGATPPARRSRVAPEADLPGYELFEAVGEGGMGVVYRARDTDLARDVAVKFLHARFEADGPAARRFLGEARVTAQLQHPGVPPVHEVGARPDGRPFLVMKLIRGRTLADLLASGRREPAVAAEQGADAPRSTNLVAVFEQVCQAVAFAHSRQVIHRDLKPANVMVGSFGEVQVMDWGLAKVLSERPCVSGPSDAAEATATAIDSDRMTGDETRAGSVLGTPAYMPPEQAIGAIDQIDARSDVFGLGGMLCAILTGKPPYVGADFEATRQMAARARLDDAFARLDGCGADPGLVALGKRCLAAEPADRPADAGEVAKAVAGLRAAADERARAAELERAKAEAAAREQRKRRRVQLALAAALGLLAVGTGAFAWYSDRQAAGREAREAGTDASVKEALRDARERTDEAWRVTDYPDRMQRATDAAVAAIRRAEDFAAGGSPTGDTLAELDAARPAVEDLARHARLITAADRNRQWYADEYRFSNDLKSRVAICTRHREALRQFGLDPISGPVDEVARAIADSRIRDFLLGILLEWYHYSYTVAELVRKNVNDPDLPADAPAVRERLRQVIRAAQKLCGGAYARWQELGDNTDIPGLVAFAASPEGLSFRSVLVIALARDLKHRKQHPASRAYLRAAVDRYPHDVWLHVELHDVCKEVQPPDWAEALSHVSAACVLRPDSPMFHFQLGLCYKNLKQYDQAAAAYRKSVSIAPYSKSYEALGFVLWENLNDREGAIAAMREAVRLDPGDPRATGILGYMLTEVGRHGESLRVQLDALRRNPDWAEHAGNGLRYHAARTAVRCADGLGVDAPPPAERPALRRQALDLLTAELAALQKLTGTEPALVSRKMSEWWWEKELASVRDAAALKRLPPEERAAWERLWADVLALSARTAPPKANKDKK